MPNSYAPTAVDPASALIRLREGNRRFVMGEGRATRSWHPGLADGQSPFAVILGCADSRAPAEYVFDQGLGDLFVIRVAGNIVAPSLIGSVEFAAGKFGTRLVVVMGHTKCGAVGATVEALEGGKPNSPNIQSIVKRITPHLEAMPPTPGGDREARMNEAVRVNALASAAELRRSSPILREFVECGRVVIVAAVFDLATGVVTFLDQE
ncbi:Carbonic anhydrase [Labilithrix luteola]|uniref:Carbonic anhydrase n=1 Tax=Labilithrix luteola TaxID=1391654 RepID=A0A0K1Q4K2_9BACT|nr:carbonic anhydrase [Labilithrix luteola]AKV00592.1 Carbonic anhydrase [Labilithrix luteola]